MKKHLIAKLMHRQKDALLSSDSYYFRPDFEYILQGLTFEFVPAGVYIWMFCFPLFDAFGLNLTFSERITEQGGFVAKGSMTEESIVEFALSSAEVRSVFDRSKPMGVSEFIRTIESLPYDWRQTRVLLVYASSLVLVGEGDRAADLLRKFAATSVLGAKDLIGYQRLRSSLEQGAEHARSLIEQIRSDNLRSLGLGASR